ncbi:SIMPL domain-containing protein [Psychromonas aquimarina]|uniref:SIMPL domain-containing protein n=1 Tax=Psychromonas aquimarina TaxID=444919 RepID=UPI0004290CBB|nr:SIMPL domain-containing protein [Psychromonas aquimarina]
MRYLQYLLLAAASAFSVSSLAASQPDEPYIAVTGSAELEVKPDQVIIQFQASALERKGALAKNEVDQQVETLLVNLQQSGFSSKELESADLYTRAEYDYQKDKRIFMGIRATRDLTYRLTDIDKVNQFLDAVLASDIEAINQLQYGLQSPEKWQLEVRQMAVEDSVKKAANLAKAYQAELGKIYSVNYQNSYREPVMMRAMSSENLDTTTYQINTIKLNDRVQAVFILQP